MKKKIIIGIVLLVLIIGCSVLIRCCYEGEDLSEVEVGELHDYFFEENIEIKTVKEALVFVNINMKYIRDSDDYWQLPEESYKKKTGDCEDYIIFFMYLLETKLDIKTSLIALENISTKEAHVITKYNNKYVDVPNMFTSETILDGWHIIWEIPYSEVMWMTYFYHNNVGKYYSY
jgi:hypothetical protein